jgi:hypothetical protein
VTWFFGYKNGSIISCLRDVKDKLRPACKKEVFKVQLAASQDFRADPQLYEACKKDAETTCKDVPHGGGRVQACLVRGPARPPWLPAAAPAARCPLLRPRPAATLGRPCPRLPAARCPRGCRRCACLALHPPAPSPPLRSATSTCS